MYFDLVVDRLKPRLRRQRQLRVKYSNCRSDEILESKRDGTACCESLFEHV